ncbi:thermonuclease family protein [Gracilibacillus salinarum]|uniref:Thermonuclease family protein n=1 Tax=Gracilibacillus salinarum TaxID=2932255 RepID=A0ABY4GR32_9BACI|nr:thermonuclease family protein [Gracilibacillus salinarum]UOQ86420.1 thermonuclease family protein [Gracilibacillus salinarum]
MLQRTVFILLFLISIFLTSCGLPAMDYSSDTVYDAEAKVIHVVDGDTIKIEINGEEENIRLLLVDTPETKHPDLPKQPFGQEASDFAEKILSGETVQVEFDGPKRDKYDRLLGYIWIDGENFNQLLLKNGLARYAYVYDPPYTHQTEMEQAEQEAQADQLGIWSIDGYVKEDGFRHEEESDPSANIYESCSEAKSAGVTPLYEGDKGYGKHLDRDLDGVACE